jgi:hypothetical protein
MVERLGYFMGLEFSPQVIADLQQEFGGHPFFTRQVCSKIHQLASVDRPVKVSSNLLSRAKTEFQGQLEQYLRDIIEHLRENYFDEFCVLKAVIEGEKSELTEFGNEAPDLIDHLIGYGVVERIGDDFDIRFTAMKNILERLVSSNSEGRWAEISRRRNALEVNIRTSLYHWSKGVSAEEWHDLLSSSLTRKRMEALSTTEPAILFSHRESPLYLTDILAIIKNEKVMPYLNHRRSLIIKYIDVINKLRKDAHANKVEDADIESAREAFDFLETEFSPP